MSDLIPDFLWITGEDGSQSLFKPTLKWHCLSLIAHEITLTLLFAPKCAAKDTIELMAIPNTLFAIINVANPAGVKEKLTQISPWVSYELQDGQWLLMAPGGTTAKEVTDKLAITTDPASTPTAVVIKADSYYGRNFAVVWDWIKSKQGTELVPNATTT